MNKLVIYIFILSLMLSGCNVVTPSNLKSSDMNTKSADSIKNNVSENEKVSIESNQKSLPNDKNETTEQFKEPTIEVIEAFDENLDAEMEPDVASLYNSLFIGELNKSSYVYIEPFKVDRGAGGTGDLKYENYPDSIQFCTIGNESNIYTAIFDSEVNTYIPRIEEGSHFYYQGEEFNQSVLRYKTDILPDHALVGITLVNHEIENIDFSIKGNKRVYSENEYNKSMAEVNDVNKFNGSDEGTLREITLDDTLVGAKQICLLKIKDSDIAILLSQYFGVGIESTADVYVIDFIRDGKVIQTIEKYNGVSQ